MKMPSFRRRPPTDTDNELTDLGFGDKVARNPGTRLINNDGEFNVVRRGGGIWSPYQWLVEMPWWKFIGVTLSAYVLINALFALIFLLLGTANLSNVPQDSTIGIRFLHAFFFSVQTFTTVGYGTMSPMSLWTNALAAIIALLGWAALALVTSLLYARFARPRGVIGFSDRALIAPYQHGGECLQFRIVNMRDNHLINLTARVVLTWLEDGNRRFAGLDLERDYVALFPLNWTIVHPITEDSPIAGWTKDDYCRRRSEILIMIEGYDETYAQSIHVNNSYIHDELVWHARFRPMYHEREMTTELHLDRLSAVERLAGRGEEE